MMHWSASMVEKPEPMLMDNQELVHLDPSASLLSSAYMDETTEPIWKDNQEMVNVDCSASLSSAPPPKHDVFLSFRGIDTRQNFISHLYNELQYVRGIQTFKDDKGLEIGDPISPSLLKAIEESKFAIVVLSKNYASSTWCLEELTKICQCMKDKNRILPLFYHVEPTDVRYQKGNFEIAFTNHENSGRHKSEKVKQWRKALETVANFSGCNRKDYKNDREVVEAIVESVCSKVQPIEIEFIISSRDFKPFDATKEAMGSVMKALKDEKVTIIGVYGMGGIGKTTMVEHVAAQAQNKRLFHKVIKANISQNPNIRKIQDTFAEMLGFKLVNETDDVRELKLMKMMRGKRILIILDDIWDEIMLSSIGIPSNYELQRCNSKVLLTTRRMDVCRSMETEAIIHLDILSVEDSWNLFVMKTGMSFQKSTDFYEIACKVARECAGLPVALIAVAKALRNKGLDDWKEAARRLKASQLSNPEDVKVVFNSIKLSYDYLRSDDARSCFLLCCLFPEDYDIKIEDLLKYGLGKGLFQDSNTMEEARATAQLVVKHLKDCSLLLDTEQDGYVRMHDVIRDVAISISLSKDGRPLFLVKAGCELKCWPKTAHECYSAISLMRNEIRMLPEKLVFSELQILLLQSNFRMNEIPDICFQSLNALMVLDLSHTRVSLLPSSFSLLTSLHTLYLDCCLSMISNISILGELRKLEILSMRELPLVKLPKEIGHLTALRMLDITGECVDLVPPKVIRNLVNLEELYMQCNFADWGSKIDEAGEQTSASFDELTGLLHLKIVKVFISDAKCLPTDVEVEPDWEKFDICISVDPSIRELSFGSSSSLDHSKSLTLDTAVDTLPKWFIDVVTKEAEKLQYIKCRRLGNILMELDYGKLHDLKYLSIGPNGNLEELMNTVTWVQNKPVFQKLEELHLVEVDCLKELCVGELPPGSLCKLRLLKVKECYKLMNALLQSNLLQRLQNLEKLICEEIDGLEYVFASEGLEPEQIVLTKLIEMRLKNLVNLIKIWNGPVPCAIFQHVKILVVSGCFKLENLFTSDVAQCLYKLEDLTVEDCHKLDRMIEANEETVNNKIVFPALKNLALVKLPNLTRFYGSIGSATTDRENIECPSLKHLHVDRCPRFSISASDFHSQNHVKFNNDE